MATLINYVQKESAKKNAESNLRRLADDEMRVSNNDKAFSVNTKFHFKNNSWTWVNGGQIKSNEWVFLPGTNQKYPMIPVQVLPKSKCHQHHGVSNIKRTNSEFK